MKRRRVYLCLARYKLRPRASGLSVLLGVRIDCLLMAPRSWFSEIPGATLVAVMVVAVK